MVHMTLAAETMKPWNFKDASQNEGWQHSYENDCRHYAYIILVPVLER